MTKFVQETFAKGTEMEIVGATWSRDCWFNWMILNDCSTLQISRAYLNSSCILFAFDSGSLWRRSERLEIVFANEFVILTPSMLMEFFEFISKSWYLQFQYDHFANHILFQNQSRISSSVTLKRFPLHFAFSFPSFLSFVLRSNFYAVRQTNEEICSPSERWCKKKKGKKTRRKSFGNETSFCVSEGWLFLFRPNQIILKLMGVNERVGEGFFCCCPGDHQRRGKFNNRKA